MKTDENYQEHRGRRRRRRRSRREEKDIGGKVQDGRPR